MLKSSTVNTYMMCPALDKVLPACFLVEDEWLPDSFQEFKKKKKKSGYS